jgi:uncharacterized membrane protein (DUF485 family)
MALGRVFNGAFRAAKGNAAAFAASSLLFASVPTFLVHYTNYDAASGDVDFANGDFWAGSLPAMLINYLLQAVIVSMTLDSLGGATPSAGRSISLGLRCILPILVATFLSYLAISFGLMLLLVPGLILLTMWILLVPVIVAEGKGALGSFGRSAELTKGSRWRIFGLLVILFVIQMGALFLAGFLGTALGGPIASAAAAAISSAFSAILLATFLASLYVELRRAKEGQSVDGLAEIFT